MSEITFNQVDVAKLNLGPDDSLIVTVKGSTEKMSGLNALAENLSETFYKNKVVVLGLGVNDEVAFTVVKEAKGQNYCTDCNCGKKEAAENDLP